MNLIAIINEGQYAGGLLTYSNIDPIPFPMSFVKAAETKSTSVKADYSVCRIEKCEEAVPVFTSGNTRKSTKFVAEKGSDRKAINTIRHFAIEK